MMVVTSPKLALVSLLVIPPGGFVAVLLGRFMRSKTAQVQDGLGKTTQARPPPSPPIPLLRPWLQPQAPAM